MTTYKTNDIKQHIDKIFEEKICKRFVQKSVNENIIRYYQYTSVDVFARKLPETILLPKNATAAQICKHLTDYRYNDVSIPYKYKEKAKNIYQSLHDNIQTDILSSLPLEMKNSLRGNLKNATFLSNYINEKTDKTIGTIDEITKYLEDEVTDNLDLDIIKAVKKVKTIIGLNQYCLAKMASATILEMSKKKSNKLPIYAYVTGKLTTILPDLKNNTSRVNHPGQLIQAVKELYQIDKGQWKTFIAMSPNTLEKDLEYIRILIKIGKNKPSNGLTKFNRTCNIGRLIHSEHQAQEQHANNIENHESSCDICATLDTSIQNLYSILSAAYDLVPTKIDNFLYACRDTMDYLRDYRRNNAMYPHHSTWNNLSRAVHSWHFEVQRRRAIQSNGNRIYEWNSLLPELHLDDYVITPLKDHASLVAEGNTMHHCVGGYWRSAINNNYRLFHIEHKDNDKDTGTLCLEPTSNDSFRINQLRSFYNRDCSSEIKKIASRILIRYRNVWNKTDPTLRIWNRTRHGETNEILEEKGFPELDITLTETYEVDEETEDEVTAMVETIR